MSFATEKVDLSKIQFTPELARCVPAEVARRFDVLPVLCHGETLTLAVGGTTPDVTVIDEVFGALCRGASPVRELQIVVADPWLLAYYLHKL
jgi:hypothetical protein